MLHRNGCGLRGHVLIVGFRRSGNPYLRLPQWTRAPKLQVLLRYSEDKESGSGCLTWSGSSGSLAFILSKTENTSCYRHILFQYCASQVGAPDMWSLPPFHSQFMWKGLVEGRIIGSNLLTHPNAMQAYLGTSGPPVDRERRSQNGYKQTFD